MDATFAGQGPGRVAVGWEPADYATELVLVARDGEPASIHTNGANYVPPPVGDEEEHALVHGEALLYGQPPGAHGYQLCEWLRDPDTGEYAVGECSAPVQVEVEPEG